MPFKSEAQRRYFHWAKRKGKISPKTVKEWEAHTPKGKKLPERVKHAAFVDELQKIARYIPPALRTFLRLHLKKRQPGEEASSKKTSGEKD
jgi:hypothetical protein